MASALGSTGKRMVVLVPPTWGRAGDDLEEDDALVQARLLLRGLTAATPFLVIADQQVNLALLGVPPAREVKLEPHAVGLGAGPDAWGAYAPYAQRLGESVAPSLRASPLVWRLAVGAAALGTPVSLVAEHCRRPAAEAFSRLVDAVAERLREQPLLFQAIRRALQIRRAEAAALLDRATGIPEAHLPLLTECLGYGDPVRFPPALRSELAKALGGDDLGPALPDLHWALATHYRGLDGVTDPGAVQSQSQMVAWIERAHHLAFAGDQGAADWRALRLPAPGFYRDRARALSIQYRKYADAAQVYLECVKRFPEDDYSHHYAGWNLEKSIQATEQHERERFSGWLGTQIPIQWEIAQAVWTSIAQVVPGLPLPAAGPGEEERAQFAWSLPDLYLEIEIDANRRLFWYARDLAADASDSGEGSLSPIPPRLVEWLKRISHA